MSAPFDQDVARLDVPVQHSPGVHLAQGRDQFEPDTGRGGGLERSVLDHELFEGAAGDEFDDTNPQPLALVHDVVDAHDIGMVDPSRGPGFAQGAFAAGSGVLRVESVDPHFLYGDLPVEHFVGGSPHPSHPPWPILSASRYRPVTNNPGTPPLAFPVNPLHPLNTRHNRPPQQKHNGHTSCRTSIVRRNLAVPLQVLRIQAQP